MDLGVGKTRISVESGERILQEVDALIHPTNTFLWFSSGFSETLKVLGGESLEQEATALGPLRLGEAVLTGPGRLKCRRVIHVAAWGQDMMPEVRTVHQAVLAALELASRNRCERVALPPAGLHVGRFPLAAAVETTFLAMIEHCLGETSVREIHYLAADRGLENLIGGLIQSAKRAQSQGKKTGGNPGA